MLAEVVSLFDEYLHENLTLSFECLEEVPEVMSADVKRIRLVLVTIIMNSIKHTQQGAVEVTCGFDKNKR